MLIQYTCLMVHWPHLHIAADWIKGWRGLTILIFVTLTLHKQYTKVINSYYASFLQRLQTRGNIIQKCIF